MKFIAGGLNGHYLRDIIPKTDEEIDKINCVKVAVAYANGDPEVFKFCKKNSIPLDFWGRLDDSIPVSTNILSNFLDWGPNYNCKFVWEFYHPKIIWFVGYGVYIGSANLTDNAWYKNIESGVFYYHDEIVGSGLDVQLDLFFQEIDKKSVNLTKPLYNQIIEHEKKYGGLKSKIYIEENRRKKEFIETVDLSFKFEGLGRVTAKTIHERMKEKFLEEWYNTLKILNDISQMVSTDNYRPQWINSNVPEGVQVDQFLHAYYYNYVRDGNTYPYEEYHKKNKNNPMKAVVRSLEWWHSLLEAPTGEQERIIEYAPFLNKSLSISNIDKINADSFPKICSCIYAFVDHAKRTRNVTLGLPQGQYASIEERTKLLSRYVWNQRTELGANIIDVIKYVLYGGNEDEVPRRLWDGYISPEYHISHFGLSCLGEIVGWAMPNKYPPRNGRSSKALKALGFNVKIHSIA